MKRTLNIGLALALGAVVGCGGGGGGTNDGGGTSSWLVGTGGSPLSSRAGGGYSGREVAPPSCGFSILCVDFVHGWVSGAGGLIIRSVDGGASWQSADSKTQNALRAVAF